jgi:hypothetical protein
MHTNLFPVLPKIGSMAVASVLENGWSAHYGALEVASRYSGFVLPRGQRFNAVWVHGCVVPSEIISPQVLICGATRAHEIPVYVGRSDECLYLKEKGYQDVRPIGVPIVYTEPSAYRREKGSLLIMPTHTLVGAKFQDKLPFSLYVHQLEEHLRFFKRVVVCLHPACIENGLWVDEFRRAGVQMITGAATNDSNALCRMRGLLEQFEYVTTNGWGSHVAYALAFGSKVSIFGSKPNNSRENLFVDPAWQADPSALEVALSERFDPSSDPLLSKFHLTPPDAFSDVELGRWLLGVDHKLSPAGMLRLLKAAFSETAQTGVGLRRIWNIPRRVKRILSAIARKHQSR